MADEFDSVVKNVKRSSTWMRIVYMIGFCVVLYVVSVVIWFLTGAQALFSIFTGSDNRNLRLLGSSLAEYVNQILKFITYNSEIRPFPFGPFPEADEDEVDLATTTPESDEQAGVRPADEGKSAVRPVDEFDDLAFLSRQDEEEAEGDDDQAADGDQSWSAEEMDAGREQEQEATTGIQTKKHARGKDISNPLTGLSTDTGNTNTDASKTVNDDQSADKSNQ
ncbi:MAG: DUF4389 domain-containing protein [Gammaproteobacteria bacterium]|nr:DUF4389 domain-containing protein [Gammaproteobacteria bacterium]